VNRKLLSALSFSFALHIILLLVLVMGDFYSHPIKPTPTAAKIQPIQAVAIDRSKVEAILNKIRKKKSDEVKRIKQIEDKAAAEKRQRAKEKIRKKKAVEEAKNQALAADKLRKKKAADKKRAKEKAAATARAKKKRDEKKAKDAEKLRKKQAADKKRKAREAKDQAIQEQMMADQMAEEMATRQKARQQQMMTEVGRYTALLTRAIQSNLITDKASMENKSCKLTIKLAPSGFVIDVVSGKGDRIVCDAASKAVYRAGKLPVSKDPEVFEKMREISLTVVPEF